MGNKKCEESEESKTQEKEGTAAEVAGAGEKAWSQDGQDRLPR